MRVASIGLGDIAQKAYLPLLASDARITPMICTRDQQRLSSISRQYRIAQCYLHVDELLSARPDAVMIHAATAAHFTLAQQSLLAGIPTFVDKPLCDNTADVEALLSLAVKHNTALMVGFNRRYLPALQSATTQPINDIHWQKHRYALPGELRQFVFDDFIHVIDSLCYYSNSAPKIDEALVCLRHQQQQVHSVAISWQHQGALMSGSMNRSAGINEERIDIYGDNLSLHVLNCVSGESATHNQRYPLAVDDWQSQLSRRGFSAMLEHWYQQVSLGVAQQTLLDSYWRSHQLAEALVDKLAQQMPA